MIGFFENLKTKKALLYGVALIVVIALVWLFLRDGRREKTYDIVVLGDSVMTISPTNVKVTTVIEERLGVTVFNGAFGGSGMTVQDTGMWGSAASVEWSMVKLAQAICNGDWQSQKAAISFADTYREYNTLALGDFESKINDLEQIDFSEVKVLIIEHGTNDYNAGRRVDNPADRFDATTYGGALRESLKLLRETYPDLRIIVVSPIYCNLGKDRTEKCYNTAYGEGGTLDEYVLLGKQIAEEYGVEWIDAYHKSGVNEDTAEMYLFDGLHLVEEGHMLLGNLIADYLEETKQGMD